MRKQTSEDTAVTWPLPIPQGTGIRGETPFAALSRPTAGTDIALTMLMQPLQCFLESVQGVGRQG